MQVHIHTLIQHYQTGLRKQTQQAFALATLLKHRSVLWLLQLKKPSLLSSQF
jgi:hypothetical protein